MSEQKEETSEFRQALDALLGGHSNECILDAILERIPKDDLCQAMLRVFERQNTIMSPTFPGDAIMCAVGLGSTLVRGEGSAYINVQPLEEFHLDRLIIPSTLAGDFLVTDIKVGHESQFNSPGCIPGMSFTENAWAIKLRGDMAHRRQFITVNVTNQNANARNFQGVLIGHLNSPPLPGNSTRLEDAA
jgi:hypothetical protein